MQNEEYLTWISEEKTKLMLNSGNWLFIVSLLLTLFLLVYNDNYSVMLHPVIYINILSALMSVVLLWHYLPYSILRAWRVLVTGIVILVCGWCAVFCCAFRHNESSVIFPLAITLLFVSLLTVYLSATLLTFVVLSFSLTLAAGSIIFRDGSAVQAVTTFITIVFIIFSARVILMRRFDSAMERERENVFLIGKLSSLASKDPLTGLYNRRYFNNYLESVFPQSEDNQTGLSLLLVDVDYFKKYNDFYGHQAGDECLADIANCLTESVRNPQDLVARYGGEEFIIALPGASMAQATTVADRVKMHLSRRALPHEASQTAHVVTVSQGVAEWMPGLNQKQLVNNADRALYLAKSRGRNCYALYRDDEDTI